MVGTYVGLWISFCLTGTVFLVFYLLATQNPLNGFLTLSSLFLNILYQILFTSIDCLVLYTFLRLSNKVKEESLNLITKILKDTSSSKADSIYENQGRDS